jgi:UDP-2,3-diacylglucosamine pyrophosphatase LpxH
MSAKFKIVVSDLHLSAGRITEGNSLEDFYSDQEFVTFLHGIIAESDHDGADVELVVNGDAFEMLQVPHVDTFEPIKIYPAEQYHSSSEEDSVRKMGIIIDGHQPFFEALGNFIQAGPPRRYVTFVKGNHDLNIHWPAVQERIRQALGATGAKASLLAFEERCISREGIYVEHGNQYAAFLDRLEDMEKPYDPDDSDQLAIPLGSWFVMDALNAVERDNYWFDGVKPITALVWYALAYDFVFAAKAIATLIRALPGVIQEGVLEDRDPRADLVRQLEDDAQVEALAARYEADEAFRAEFNAQVANILTLRSELPSIDVAPLSAVPDPVKMGDQIREQVNSSLYKSAARCAAEKDVELVIFGHTHDAGLEPLPDGGVYINSGTWTWRADFSEAGARTWKELFEHPERFTEDRLLSYVRIDYDDAGQPTAQLLSYEPPPTPGPELEEPPQPEPSFWGRLLAWLRRIWGT